MVNTQPPVADALGTVRSRGAGSGVPNEAVKSVLDKSDPNYMLRLVTVT